MTIAIILLIIGGATGLKNISLKKDLKASRIQAESLVAENLSLSKTSAKLNKDIKTLEGQNKLLNENLASTNQKIIKKEAEISRLKAQSANAALLAKKVKELEQLKAEQEKQIQLLNKNVKDLDAKNSELSDMLDELKSKNMVLTQNIQILKAMEGNNYRTEALRGKAEKVTVIAARAKKLVVNVDVPSDAVQSIKFKLKTPSGKEILSGTDKNATVNVPKTQAAAPGIKLNDETMSMSKVELVYVPEKKLEKGLYTIDIMNKDQYAGTTQIRLR